MIRRDTVIQTSPDSQGVTRHRRRSGLSAASLPHEGRTPLPQSIPKEQWYIEREHTTDTITHCESCGGPFTSDGYEQVTPRGARVMREYFHVGGNGMPRRKVCARCWHRPRVAPSVAEFM